MKAVDIVNQFVQTKEPLYFSKETRHDGFPRYENLLFSRKEKRTIVFIKETQVINEQNVFACVDLDMKTLYTSLFLYEELGDIFEIM